MRNRSRRELTPLRDMDDIKSNWKTLEPSVGFFTTELVSCKFLQPFVSHFGSDAQGARTHLGEGCSTHARFFW